MTLPKGVALYMIVAYREDRKEMNESVRARRNGFVHLIRCMDGCVTMCTLCSRKDSRPCAADDPVSEQLQARS